ncbi:MAG: hypothetical protein ACYCS3_03650 [Acidithiobacillus sp.]
MDRVSGCIFVNLDANQSVGFTAKVAIGIGEYVLISVKILLAIRITTKVKWDELLSSYMSRRMIRVSDQIFDPTPGHANFQLGEFTVRHRIADNFPPIDPFSDFACLLSPTGLADEDSALACGVAVLPNGSCPWDAQPKSVEANNAADNSLIIFIYGGPSLFGMGKLLSSPLRMIQFPDRAERPDWCRPGGGNGKLSPCLYGCSADARSRRHR